MTARSPFVLLSVLAWITCGRATNRSALFEGGCVGTIAGVPLHAPVEGQPALLASIALSSAALVDPASPGSVVLPLFEKVLLSGSAGVLSLLAGGGADASSSTVRATKASLYGSTFVATGRGGLLIADQVSLRRMDDSGQLHAVVGNLPEALALDAASNVPTCLFADVATGDIFICSSSTVRGVHAASAASSVFSVAGNGTSAFVDGVLATATGFSDIRDVHTSPNGDLIVAMNDFYIHPRIIRISSADGIARTIIGRDASGMSGRTQLADSAYFRTGTPSTAAIVGAVAVCVQSNGTIFFSDGTLIGSLSAEDTLTVVAGVLPSLKAPIIDGGLASMTTFYRISGLRLGHGPELIVTDVGVVYRVNLETQRVFAVAGRAQFVQLNPALSRPPNLLLATSIPLPWPYDVTVDPASGDVFCAVATGNVIVRVSATDGTMSVIAGTGSQGCGLESVATLASLGHATSIALDWHGGLVIADRRCCLVRHLDLESGTLQILAGKSAIAPHTKEAARTRCALLCLTGNTSSFCASAYAVSPSATPSMIEEPVRVIHEQFYITVDKRTGDLYWTEDLARRVLVLRANTSIPKRLAGTGAKGADAGGFVAAGAIALNTALAGPRSIAIDSHGSPVFIDGYQPGRIVYVTSNGVLEALVTIRRGSLSDPSVDGPLDRATAYSLSGLAFLDGDSTLLVADTASTSIVRLVDLDVGAVSSIIGARVVHNVMDGSLFSDTTFGQIIAIAVAPGGNIIMSDVGSNTLRIAIARNATYVNCPSGFSCACGTPVPCTDPHFFCPPNQRQPQDVTRGFFAVPAECHGGLSTQTCFVDQKMCPIGSYCIDGIAHACSPGTYGTDAMQAVPDDCMKCPVGTFNAIPGADSKALCVQCPAGTFSAASGAALCTLCPANHFNVRVTGNEGHDLSIFCLTCQDSFASLPGSSSCVEIGPLSVATAGNVFTARYVTSLPDHSHAYIALALLTCLPLLILAASPLLCNALGAMSVCYQPRARACHRTCNSIRKHSSSIRKRLRVVDLFSLHHYVDDGSVLVKRRTSVGGALSILAIGVIACAIVVLILEFCLSNSVTSSALLPAELPTLQRYASSSTANEIASASMLSSLLPPISRGLLIVATAYGSGCHAPVFSSSALLAGKFEIKALPDNVSKSELVIACADCVLGPLSSITIVYPPTCQTFLVTATSVGATGGISLTSIQVPASDAEMTTTYSRQLSTALLSFEPHLEVVEDARVGSVTRGYTLGDASTYEERDAEPMSTIVSIDLAADSTYTLITITYVRTWAQLLSSIVGLSGLLGLFGCVYRATTFARRIHRRLSVIRGPLTVASSPSFSQVTPKVVTPETTTADISSSTALSAHDSRSSSSLRIRLPPTIAQAPESPGPCSRRTGSTSPIRSAQPTTHWQSTVPVALALTLGPSMWHDD